MVSIRLQVEAFDIAYETDLLMTESTSIGAVVTFIGLVRDVNEDVSVGGLYLEHYPGMTEKEIQKIVDEARQRWALEGVRVVHRVGDLKPADPIVFVGVGSQHRGDAFAACEFIMDYLKTRAPIWKKETGAHDSKWLDARESDQEKLAIWE